MRPVALPTREQGLFAGVSLTRRIGHESSLDLPERIVAALRWSVRAKDLGSRDGGHKALLIPLFDGGFSILIDPEPPNEANAPDRLNWWQWRVAHELAHSIFYRPGTPPKRAVSYVREEEEFCDGFAAGVLKTFV
jgi:hypothetical protein